MPVQFPLILLSVVTELLQQLVSLVAAHILLRFSGHHFWMLGNQVFQRVVQPERRILHSCGDCVVALLVSNMTVTG